MQVLEPLITGQVSFFGAVMSEQAEIMTAEMMAIAAKSLLRVMVELLIKERGGIGRTKHAKRIPP